MSDHFFRDLLGVKPGATKKEIKRAFHHLARENHPDLFPEEKKMFQELRMITLNEAYAYLMAFPEGIDDSGQKEGLKPPAPTIVKQKTVSHKEVAFHKDPSYAYYKQGFVKYSRALHGIEALYRTAALKKRVSFEPRYDAYQRFAKSLVLLRRSHEYFSRVVDEYPESVWRRDAEIKLKRIEKFSELYRKIIANLKD